MRSWSQIYLQRIKASGGTQKYLQIKVREKTLFLKKIVTYAGKHGKILEAGCGTGVLSTFLSNQGFKVMAVDVDEGMLNVARKISENFSQKPIFRKINLFNLQFPENYFDLVFSHGVLEHFTDKEIVTLLNMQLKISKILIFSVPSNYLSNKDRYFGNERFLSMGKWEGIINNTEGEVIETFGFHYLIGWRGYWDTFIRGKILGPSPYFVFVLQKK